MSEGCPFAASSCGGGRERESKLSPVSFYKDTIPFLRALASWHNYRQKAPCPNTISLGISASAYELEEDTDSL